MLSDPEKYRDRITSQYQASMPGSTDLPTLERIQAERKTVLGVPVGGGVADWSRAALERLGLARGDAALKQAREDMAATEKKDLNDAARMREEAARRLPDAFARAGRPDYALKVLAAASEGDDVRRPVLAVATEAMLARSPRDLSLDERLEAYGLLSAELAREKKGWSPATEAGFRGDTLAYIGRSLDAAQAEPDSARRALLLASARSWLTNAPPKDPKTAGLRARLEALEKTR
jgi:hypothetical protein